MEKNRTTEQAAAATLLQKPVTVKAGGREYAVARPTLATLAAVSALCSRITAPVILQSEDAVRHILATAETDAPLLARIAATLILGAPRPGWARPLRLWRMRRLARRLLHTASCEETDTLITRALTHQRIGFFLSATASLGAANELRARKETTSATARGE